MLCKEGWKRLKRYTITVDQKLDQQIKEYMKKNRLSTRSASIKKCIKEASESNEIMLLFSDINNKLNRLLYRENINKKLLEQIYVNMGFPVNEELDNNILLHEFYDRNFQRYGDF